MRRPSLLADNLLVCLLPNSASLQGAGRGKGERSQYRDIVSFIDSEALDWFLLDYISRRSGSHHRLAFQLTEQMLMTVAYVLLHDKQVSYFPGPPS